MVAGGSWGLGDVAYFAGSPWPVSLVRRASRAYRVRQPGRGAGRRAEGVSLFALAIVVTVLLLLEALPSAIAALVRAQAGVTRLDQLTRLGLLEGRRLWVVSLLGVLHLAACALVIVGLFAPVAGVAGGAVEAVVFAWVLSRQLGHGDRGRALFAYLLFTVLAVAVLVVDLLRV